MDEEVAKAREPNETRYIVHTNENVEIGLVKESMVRILLEPKPQKRIKKIERLQSEMEYYILPNRELSGKD